MTQSPFMTQPPFMTQSIFITGSIPRAQIAQSFSRAACSYDAAARLQREVGDGLWQLLPAQRVQRAVDVGCGTGFMTGKLAGVAENTVAVDVAAGMLSVVTQQHLPGVCCVQADMEHLPLADNTATLLLSNLALQWAGDLANTFAEWRRVLHPGGTIAFTTFLPGTLHELQSSWQRVDDAMHVNRFVPLDAVQAALRSAGFVVQHLAQQSHVCHYDSVQTLSRELKAIGAHNMNSGRLSGLAGRQRWQAMQRAYEYYREQAGLPATYEVLYVVAR